MSDLPGAYGHADYAASLVHVGQPVELKEAGGWLISRDLEGASDLAAPYPLLCCRNLSALESDLFSLSESHVSVTAVIDPMAEPMVETNEQALRSAFVDRVVRYKEHFVVDLEPPLETTISGHHRRKTRRGGKRVRVQRSDMPAEWLTEFNDLYGMLIEHHGIRGAAAFGRESLSLQLGLPGTRAYLATIEDRPVSMTVWYLRGNGASYHLGATSPEGYLASASYALFARVLADLKDEGASWAHLGAGAGAHGDATDGLTAFKKGWSTHTRTAYLCGRILQPETYAELCRKAGVPEDGAFFPAYRT
ncbi:MAG: GNAT family N-acetyltransferase [Planctomycetota bacterium]